MELHNHSIQKEIFELITSENDLIKRSEDGLFTIEHKVSDVKRVSWSYKSELERDSDFKTINKIKNLL